MECLLCGNPLEPMHSADVGVATIEHWGPLVCQECIESEDEEIRIEAGSILDDYHAGDGEPPF